MNFFVQGKFRLALASCLSACSAMAQTPFHIPPPTKEIPLYEGVAPGSEHWDWEERTFTTRRGNNVTQNVVRPVLQFYPAAPAKVCGTAVIVAPGGGCTNLMVNNGIDTLRFLTAIGVHVFVLKYRLIYVDPNVPLPPPGPALPPPPAPMDANGIILDGPQKGQNYIELAVRDGRQAVLRIRDIVGELNVKTNRVGFIGFSAGSVLGLALVDGPRETRPDFIGAIYGAKEEPLPPPDAPPLFIAVAADDEWAASPSLALFAAWRKAKRPAELHVFQTGGHGFVVKGGGGDHCLERFQEWMTSNGWLSR
ncbi:MAG: hypothetical protein JNJ82_16235 [Opitutaceae bacterium]|nr:hypothetical protein [Opitutaceae bacterium]